MQQEPNGRYNDLSEADAKGNKTVSRRDFLKIAGAAGADWAWEPDLVVW
jgi:hypothetical protein